MCNLETKETKLRLAVCLAPFLTVFALASPAFGCDCINRNSLEADVAASAAVFVGEVVDISSTERHWNQEITLPGKKVHFRVLDMIKPAGGSQDHLEVVTGTGGGDCGLVPPRRAFYLVYAFRRNEGAGQLETSICTRSAPLLCAREDLEKLGRRNPPYLKEAMASPEEMGRLPCVTKPKLLNTDDISWPPTSSSQSALSYPLIVKLTLTIDVSGDVLDVRIDEVLPEGEFLTFRREVLQKVKGWKFRPAIYRGQAVSVTTQWELQRPGSAMPG